MKILLVTYSISGGAGKACKRLYEALKSSGYQVKILKLEPGMNHDESIVSMYSTSQSFYFKKIISKIYKKLLDFRFKNYNKNYKLPFSVHKVENHPLVKWADIINLHWVADFIDYSRFFKLVSKPIVDLTCSHFLAATIIHLTGFQIQPRQNYYRFKEKIFNEIKY